MRPRIPFNAQGNLKMKMPLSLLLAAICLSFLALVCDGGMTSLAYAQSEDPFGGDLEDLFADDDPFGGGADEDPFDGGGADEDPFGGPAPPKIDPETSKSDAKKTAEDGDPSDSENSEDSEPEPPPPPIDPELMRIFLSNGNILTGKLSTDAFTVTTPFGQLNVPVTRVNSLTPGLSTHADVYSRLRQLIDELGVDDFPAREEAQKALAKWGLPIRGILQRYRDDGNAERARRVKEILAQLNEAAADLDEMGQAPVDWIEGDTVVTDRFTVVGSVAPQGITVASKYGELTVPLADVKEIRRLAAQSKAPVVRSIVISGEYIAQTKYRNSGIRVEKGDFVTVSAQGRISRSGSSSYWSGPDGSERFGSFQEKPPIAGGALVGKIGRAGKVVLIGSSRRFLAEETGTIYFGIGMRSDYVGRYQFPGQYTVKIRVMPKR
jgi:hypothetical protein